MTDQVATLQAELEEKEQVIATLTERLEQAAEQLDRLRRSGADRSSRGGGGGGIPQELLEEQKSLAEQLSQAVQQWEEMQAGQTLGRIESRVEELRNLVGEELLSRLPAEAPSQPSPSAQASQVASSTGHKPAETEEPSDEAASGSWESLKAEMLQDDSSAEPAPQQPSAEESHTEPDRETDATVSPQQPEEITPCDPPEPLDLEAASRNELQEAVNLRDAYITYLLRKLRATETHTTTLPAWEQLGEVPEELRQQLEALKGRLEEALREAEVELSLERARLGREEVRLSRLEEQLQKEKKGLGLADAENGAEQKTSSPQRPAGKDRRWMHLLGLKGNGDS